MRSTLSLALICAAGFASADRLITIPTGTKVTLNTIKFESLWEQSRARTVRSYAAFGVTNAIDMQIETEKFNEVRTRTTFDFAYNLIPPITGIGPGISFGMQDALNTSRDGRRLFIAITQREGYADTVNGSVAADITIGGYFGAISSPFVGMMLPFTDKVRFLAEYNGRRISAGLDVRPVPYLGLRAIFENHDVLLGAQVTIKF